MTNHEMSGFDLSGLTPRQSRPRVYLVLLAALASALLFFTVVDRVYRQNRNTFNDGAAQKLSDLENQLNALGSRIDQIEGWPAESARIKTIFPELTDLDLNSLHRSERSLSPFQAAPIPAEYERDFSAQMSAEHLVSKTGAFNRYFSAPDVEVRVDPSLPPPALEIERPNSLYPAVRANVDNNLENASLYFEFDTTPSFDSPNFWRQPALVPETFPANLTGRAGLGYNIFLTHFRNIENSREVQFPFRVTAMALPGDWNSIDFWRLALLAQLVGYGLSEDDLIKEIFIINRQRVLYSHETVKRPPIDTFKAGLGECIHANELTGTMLELNGLRFRTVGGFNPTLRNVYPGAGHASIEVLRSNGDWEYLDPYLDAYSPGTSAANFRDHPLGSTVIFRVDRKRYASAALPINVTLSDIFKYRIYSDSAHRLPPATMLQLTDGEQQYGQSWPLRLLKPSEHLNLQRDLPQQFRVYVRGRYIVSKCRVVHDISCADPDARASPWAETSFVVHPIDLLTASSQSPSLPTKH
jgi:hypothetical protein